MHLEYLLRFLESEALLIIVNIISITATIPAITHILILIQRFGDNCVELFLALRYGRRLSLELSPPVMESVVEPTTLSP